MKICIIHLFWYLQQKNNTIEYDYLLTNLFLILVDIHFKTIGSLFLNYLIQIEIRKQELYLIMTGEDNMEGHLLHDLLD